MKNNFSKNRVDLGQNEQFSLTDYSVGDLIPHSPPMVLLDSISSYSEESLTAVISINEDSKFYDPRLKGVPSWVGIEYMAQAIATFSGIHSKIANKGIKLGFLLGSRKYQIINKVFANHHTYEIFVEKLYQDGSGLASFDCKILEQRQNQENLLCVESKVNVFEPDEEI